VVKVPLLMIKSAAQRHHTLAQIEVPANSVRLYPSVSLLVIGLLLLGIVIYPAGIWEELCSDKSLGMRYFRIFGVRRSKSGRLSWLPESLDEKG